MKGGLRRVNTGQLLGLEQFRVEVSSPLETESYSASFPVQKASLMNATTEKIGRMVSICFAAVNAVTLILLLNGFLRIRSHFAAIFKELANEVALPTITTLFLAVSPTVLTALGLGLLALLIAKEWLRPAWIPIFLNALWLALGCALCFLFVLAMFAPLISIIGKISP